MTTVDPSVGIDRTIPFVETHHHLWELDRFPYSWLREPGTSAHNEVLGDYKLLQTDWGPGRLFREFYGQRVIKSVHIEADSGGDPVAETVWLAEVARQYGMPNALVVFCNLEGDAAEGELARHLKASALVRGIRLREHPADPSRVTFRRGYGLLRAAGLHYELNASPGTLLSGRTTADEFPDVPVVLCHAGYPLSRDLDYFKMWKREMSGLAEAENVHCKISGLGMGDNHWTIESIRPWVLHCIEAFGVDRCMFATNWPVDILYASYMEQVDAYRSILVDAGFGLEDQVKMLSRNAERFYRI